MDFFTKASHRFVVETFTSFSGPDHYSVTEQFNGERTMTASIGTPSVSLEKVSKVRE